MPLYLIEFLYRNLQPIILWMFCFILKVLNGFSSKSQRLICFLNNVRIRYSYSAAYLESSSKIGVKVIFTDLDAKGM